MRPRQDHVCPVVSRLFGKRFEFTNCTPCVWVDPCINQLFVQVGFRAQATSVVAHASIPQQLPIPEEPLDAGTVKLTKMTVEDFPRHLQVDDFGVGAYSGLGFTWVSYHQLLVDYHMETQRKALHQWP